MQRPSKKQYELFRFIDGFIRGNGYGPSYREIMRALDYKSVSTVAIHVDGLIARGYLRKRDRSARSLEVVDGGEAMERPQTSEHEQWLLDVIMRQIRHTPDLPPRQLADLRTVAETLRITGFAASYHIAAAALDKYEKQLDQSAG